MFHNSSWGSINSIMVQMKLSNDQNYAKELRCIHSI
jgi:hypothetical protein